MDIGSKIKKRREELGMSQTQLAELVGFTSRSAITKVEKNVNGVTRSKVAQFAEALKTTPAYLMGWDEDKPTIAEDFTTFPVIGDIAAGYDRIAVEDWTGETVNIPNSYLKGRNKDDFLVLCVKGDSMYPMYQEDDKVLILRQNSLDYSGQIGAVIYDDCATLKKVEYKNGEDWLKLIPVNPAHPPKRIENEELEHCIVLGVPKLLIREIAD